MVTEQHSKTYLIKYIKIDRRTQELCRALGAGILDEIVWLTAPQG